MKLNFHLLKSRLKKGSLVDSLDQKLNLQSKINKYLSITQIFIN